MRNLLIPTDNYMYQPKTHSNLHYNAVKMKFTAKDVHSVMHSRLRI